RHRPGGLARADDRAAAPARAGDRDPGLLLPAARGTLEALGVVPRPRPDGARDAAPDPPQALRMRARGPDGAAAPSAIGAGRPAADRASAAAGRGAALPAASRLAYVPALDGVRAVAGLPVMAVHAPPGWP